MPRTLIVEEDRQRLLDERKAERKLEYELRRGWGNAQPILTHRPNECGKHTKAMPRLDDKWN